MTDIQRYFQYWGKAERDGDRFHLLPYHSLDVAAVGHALLTQDVSLRLKYAAITGLDEPVCTQWLILLLALHDIGKFSETFQSLRPGLYEKLQVGADRTNYTVRHDSLGALFFKTAFEMEQITFPPDTSYDDWQDVVMAMIRPFTGHHGMPPQQSNQLYDRFFGKNATEAAVQFVHDAGTLIIGRNDAASLPAPLDIEDGMKKASWLMAGFVVLCDWIGSNSEWFSFCEETMPLEVYWNSHAIPQAEKAILSAGINAGVPLTGQPVFSGLFPEIATPSPLQAFAESCPIGGSPQLFILEDVTGSGKTEAALLLASRLMSAGSGKGLFVALPTMATSNAMYGRLAKVYDRLFSPDTNPSLVLAHGARHLSESFMASIAGSRADTAGEESASAQCSSWLADSRKKSLLADIGVGTLDQALLAVLPARFQSLRLFGLSGHILVVDEVHAYDPYMNKLLQNLLTFHAALGGSAILLSATLPNHIRKEFVSSFARGRDDQRQLKPVSEAYPLVSSYSSETGLIETPVDAVARRRCSVNTQLVADADEVVSLIIEAAQAGKCVCWIRNTVYDALSAHAAMKDRLDEDCFILFHARFAMGDRLDIENRVTSLFGSRSTALERHGKVLVATQVVEQSLDLDFDLLVTDLAPMDLLIQRAGRLHRHHRDEHGNPLADGKDRREPALLIIHSPPPEDNADSNWYKSAFPKAASVYPSHGCLWLTASLLSEKSTLKMPDDARVLIEAAYNELADRIPASLQQRDLQADAQWQADRSLAHINMLKFDEGYKATVNQWREDMLTPTRLGGMETTVRLARWDGLSLTSWYKHERFSWDMSQVNIRSGMVDKEIIHGDLLGKEIARLKDQLPDKGKWTVLVALEQGIDGRWRGRALNKRDEQVVLEYDCLTGVTVTKKEV